MAPSHVVIAGVNKAGTTSLFASLSEHPAIAPASIKETRYFLPARYGKPLAPRATYDEYFADAAPGSVRLEATPSYFYGDAAVARAIDDALPDPRVVVVLREPVSRAISFFRYQKVRLRFAEDLPFADYLASADRLVDADFQDPANERYMAVRGGSYADDLPAWLDQYGTERLRVVYFEDLVADPLRPLRDLAEWLELDPAGIPTDLSSENQTTAFKLRTLQRVALFGNDRSERFLRKHMGLKRRLRSLYYRLNGQRAEPIPDSVRAELATRFREPNARLAATMVAAGIPLPGWLEVPARPVVPGDTAGADESDGLTGEDRIHTAGA
ncbi:MAG: hypothetical protein JWL73_104 [Actinomycetia bacterium]|nr:hypothetical protein [Actinomycetes bacterium]